MSWALWLWVGLTIGAFAGVGVMCLMIMSRSLDVEDDLRADEGPAP